MSFGAVIWKDWIVFRSKIAGNTLSAVVGPLLYIIAFGWGIGGGLTVDGQSYLAFVIPGIAAMNSMSISFSSIANDLNISRLYDKTFEAEMMSPVNTLTFTLAKVTFGALRGIYSAALILLVSLIFDHSWGFSAYFALVLVLNCCTFSAIGFIAGLKIKSHSDMAKVSNFVITPMSFLCGTLFPLSRFPTVLRVIFECLPLSQTVTGLRAGAFAPSAWLPPVVLAAWLAVMLPIAVRVCKTAE